MATVSKRSLELREDMRFERRQWFVQRVGWAVVVALLLLALLGVFGKGPLSHATASAGDLRITYERFAHANAPTSLHVQLADPPSGTLRLSINRAYLDTVAFDHLRPEAVRVVAAGENLVYEFAAPEQGDFELSIDATPQKPGRASAELEILQSSGARVLHFQQLIYP